MRTQLAAQTAAIAQLTATNAQQMQMIMQLTAGNTHSTASGGIMMGSHADARVVSTSPAMTATTTSMPAPKPRTPSVDPSQPSMREFASPKTIPTSNSFASLTSSSSAPTTPVAPPRALSLDSPIAPIQDVNEHKTVTTPRSRKKGAANSGRKRVQSVSPSRSPLDAPLFRTMAERRASSSTPASAANLSQRMNVDAGNAEAPKQHASLISKLTTPATAPAKSLKRRK
jgi:hypothetical protein